MLCPMYRALWLPLFLLISPCGDTPAKTPAPQSQSIRLERAVHRAPSAWAVGRGRLDGGPSRSGESVCIAIRGVPLTIHGFRENCEPPAVRLAI